MTTASGRKLPVIISRKPERYSSAAPMTADARQRIVTELVDFPDGITISVSVRPAQHLVCLHDSAHCTTLPQLLKERSGMVLHMATSCTTTGKLIIVSARDTFTGLGPPSFVALCWFMVLMAVRVGMDVIFLGRIGCQFHG